MKKSIISLSMLFATLIFMCSCSNDDTVAIDNVGNGNYLLALALPATDLYPFHVLEDVSSGEADIFGAQEIPDIPYNVPVIGKNGYVYLNSENKLTKYKAGTDGVLEDVGSVVNTGISGGPVACFLSDSRLLVSTGSRSALGGVFDYQIINTDNMTEESKGTITLPITEGSQSSPSLYIPKDGKIYVPFYHADAKYVSYNEASVAVYDAETMAYEKVIKTDKAAGLGFSVVSSHAITENGDLYLTASNTDYWGANETIPSGIVRIKANASDFDDSYFFNLSDKFGGNHTGGMAYAGNNKAVVQVFRSDLVTAYKDYQNSFVIEYYSIDLETKVTKKLDVPLSKYPRRTVKSIGNGEVAIVGNTEEGNFIYIYNEATDSVSKGLEYKGTETIESFVPFY